MASRGEFIRRLFLIALACLIGAGFPESAKADKPYFVTYDDQMEEPGNFELASPKLTSPTSLPTTIRWKSRGTSS